MVGISSEIVEVKLDESLHESDPDQTLRGQFSTSCILCDILLSGSRWLIDPEFMMAGIRGSHFCLAAQLG